MALTDDSIHKGTLALFFKKGWGKSVWQNVLCQSVWVWGWAGRIYVNAPRGACVFRLSNSLLSLLYSCAHRWVPVSFPFTCACWGIARWVLLLLLLFSSYSFRFFYQFGFPCDDVASWSCCRLEFYKSRLSVCAVCRSLGPGEYVQCDIWCSGQDDASTRIP